MRSTIYGDGKFHYNARTGEYRKVLKRNLKEVKLPSGATCYEVKYTMRNLKTQKRYSTLEEAERFMAMCQNLLDRERMSRQSSIDESGLLEYPETLLRDIGIGSDAEGYYDFIVPEFEERFEKASSALSDREKHAIVSHYRDMAKLDDVGKSMGVSRERARQVISKGMRKLRHPSRIAIFTTPKDRYYLISQSEKDAMIAEFKAKLEHDFSEMTYEKALEIVKAHDAAQPKPDYSKMDIIELDLSIRSWNCLRHAGITTVGELQGMGKDDLLLIRNMGKKSAKEVLDKLRDGCGIELPDGLVRFKR